MSSIVVACRYLAWAGLLALLVVVTIQTLVFLVVGEVILVFGDASRWLAKRLEWAAKAVQP